MTLDETTRAALRALPDWVLTALYEEWSERNYAA